MTCTNTTPQYVERLVPTEPRLQLAADIGPNRIAGTVPVLSEMCFTDTEIKEGLLLQVVLTDERTPGPTSGGTSRTVAVAPLLLWRSRLFVVDVIPVEPIRIAVPHRWSSAAVSSCPQPVVDGAHWYRLLCSAILEWAADHDVNCVYFPTTSRRTTTSQVPFGIIGSWFTARRYTVRPGFGAWLAAPEDNVGKTTMRTWARDIVAGCARSERHGRPSICIVHTFLPLPACDSRITGQMYAVDETSLLDQVLRASSANRVPLTLCVSSEQYSTWRELPTEGANIVFGFCPWNWPPHRLDHLQRTRAVNSEVSGFRVPHDAWTPEMSDTAFAFYDFRWVIYTPGTKAVEDVDDEVDPCKVVRLPTSIDDSALTGSGESYAIWETDVLRAAQNNDPCVIELSMYKAGVWLCEYERLLSRLKRRGTMCTCDRVAEEAIVSRVRRRLGVPITGPGPRTPG